MGLIAHALHECAEEPESVEHFAERLESVARHLEELADSTLTLADVQESRLAQPVKRLDVGELVDKAVARSTEAARGRGVKLKLKRTEEAAVDGNKSSLLSALENLIVNAIHYSPKGSKVQVASQVYDAEKVVAISVVDQGIGIAPDEQERVFERFYRTDQARSRRVGGTGLGLSIVKHTVQAHGGSVLVDSQVGAGSTFTVILPLAGDGEAAP